MRAFREADAAKLRYLSDDEARRLTNACAPDFRILVTAALLTGCRYGELAAMAVNDFNPDAGTMRVRTSRAVSRVMWCSPRRSRFRRCGPVGIGAMLRSYFCAAMETLGRPEQQRPLAAACAAARVDPPINFRGLRRTYASRLAMGGAPLAVIAAQLGHADTRMVERSLRALSPDYIAETVRASSDNRYCRAVERRENYKAISCRRNEGDSLRFLARLRGKLAIAM